MEDQYEPEYYGQTYEEEEIPEKENHFTFPVVQLKDQIKKQLTQIIELTGLPIDLALVLLQKCNWKMSKVIQSIVDQNHFKIIGISQTSPSKDTKLIEGQCVQCLKEKQCLIENYCGHSACSECWLVYLKMKLHQQQSQLFPQCIECSSKLSPRIYEILSQKDNQFGNLYNEKLWINFAQKSSSFKMCKGKLGCNFCLKSSNLPIVFECKNCNSCVCGKCGYEYHVPLNCSEIEKKKFFPVTSNQQLLEKFEYDFNIDEFIQRLSKKSQVGILELDYLRKLYNCLILALIVRKNVAFAGKIRKTKINVTDITRVIKDSEKLLQETLPFLSKDESTQRKQVKHFVFSSYSECHNLQKLLTDKKEKIQEITNQLQKYVEQVVKYCSDRQI